ncbi:MAG: 2-dehydropantoate 2-reductase [Rhizobiales bacterium]|nr:2-dehydropantoate 2-reductase [Hyphomicrobiales bacterium]
MKIATMATGGIGGYLAVRLANTGHQVATIARGAHLDAIRQNGLSLDGFDGQHTINPWIATDDPTEVGEVDAIIFGVKGDALETAARACVPMLGPSTIVVPFLNGVEASDMLANILPEENVGNGVAQVSTTIAAPGVIKQTGEFNRFILAERDSQPSARLDALRDAINEAGSSSPATDDIVRDLWSKFVLFSAVSGVTAAARCTISDIVGNDHLAALFQAILAETAALGRARGVALPDSIEADIWSAAQNLPPKMRASTAIDLEHGRPLEIDWISGAVDRLSTAAGLDAPVNRALYALLSPYRNGAA